MPVKNHCNRRSGHIVVIFMTLFFIVSCGADNNPVERSAAWSAMTNADVSVRRKLHEHVKDRYLWYRELPDVDLTEPRFSNLTELLETLRKQPEDRFSGFVDSQVWQQRFQQGVTGAYGLRFALREQDNPDAVPDIRIASVEDQGSVAAAGLQRGDRIIAAQGRSIEDLGFDGFFDIFQEPGLGVQRELTVRHPDGTESTVTITRTEFTLSPVRKGRVFANTQSGRRVGYVQISEFIGATTTQLEDYRAEYGNSGIDDLIIDLRYNGGGLVSASRDLASTVFGQFDTPAIYTTLERNDKHTAENVTFYFSQLDNAYTTLSRVFVLTTEATCSASEEVINGLLPFMEVVTVGATTCGKPYASRTYNLIPDVLAVNVLDSRSINAEGEGEFFEGFTPDCFAEDDPVLPFDDPAESLIAVALHYAQNDSCPEIARDTSVKRVIYRAEKSRSGGQGNGAIYRSE